MKRFIDKIGFAATESALVLVILGMLAGTSYYVWRSNQQAKASLDAASQSAASTVQTHKLASAKQIKSSPPQPQNAQYLTIKEWGVRFILPQAITNATYVMQAGIQNSAFLSLKSFEGTPCGAKNASVGQLFRYSKTDKDVSSGKTYISEFGNNHQIGSYYYMFVAPQSACTNDNVVQSQASTASLQFSKAITASLQAAP
jgi:hypothetical protein